MNQADEREQRRVASVEQYKIDVAPVVAELRTAGFDVDSVGEVYNSSKAFAELDKNRDVNKFRQHCKEKLDYQNAIPILAKWLPLISNADVKEDIIRALSVKWATKVPMLLALLIDEFKQACDDPAISESGIPWAIGNALYVLANEKNAEDMINLSADNRYGSARQMIVLGLGKLKVNIDRAVNVLINLLNDSHVVGHAVIALGKLKAKDAIPYIEPLLNHQKSWVRKEAKKAIERIKKAKN